MSGEERIRSFQHFRITHSRLNRNTKGFASVFIEPRQHFVGPAIAELVVNEVDAPDVIWIFWPEADDRAIFVIQPLLLFMALRLLQAFFTPLPFNLLVIDLPAFDTKQLSNLPIAIAAILLG